MYNKLLENVVNLVEKTAQQAKPKADTHSEFYNMLFNPEEFEQRREKEAKIERAKNALIIGATSLAVLGEVTHLVKSSGILKRLKK